MSVKKAVRGVEHAISAFISYTISLAQARAEAAERLERIDMVLLIDAMTLFSLRNHLTMVFDLAEMKQ
jgi:hypothetical protein